MAKNAKKDFIPLSVRMSAVLADALAKYAKDEQVAVSTVVRVTLAKMLVEKGYMTESPWGVQ